MNKSSAAGTGNTLIPSDIPEWDSREEVGSHPLVSALGKVYSSTPTVLLAVTEDVKIPDLKPISQVLLLTGYLALLPN